MPRSIRGGRRTEEEKLTTKCGDIYNDEHTNVLQPDVEIPVMYAFRIGRACYDIRTLRDRITRGDPDKVRILHKFNPANPRTKLAYMPEDAIVPEEFIDFTRAEFKKINKKLVKLGMLPLKSEAEVRTNINFFNEIFSTLAQFEILEYGNEKRKYWKAFRKEGYPDPFEFFNWEKKCDSILEQDTDFDVDDPDFTRYVDNCISNCNDLLDQYNAEISNDPLSSLD
jgi:hypothetical protein